MADATPSHRGFWWLPLVALAIALGLVYWYVEPIRHWVLDDAYISFRYAEHFADGKGLVFNEGERVEGYTTFLWVFVLGLAKKVGFDIEVSARVLGATFSLGSFALLLFAGRFLRGVDRTTSSMALILLGSCVTFTTWTISGMEVPLVGLLGLAAVLVYSRALADDDRRLYAVSGVLCALAAMARPDAGLLFVALAGDRLVARLRGGGRGLLAVTAGLGALYGPYFLWRYLYYGFLLPNTFYAKVGGTWAQISRGLEYFTRFSGASFVVLCIAVAGIVVAEPLRRRFGRVSFIPAYLALHTLYVVAVGGDAQPSFRFFGEVMPLLCLWTAMSCVALVTVPWKRLAFVALAVAFNVYQAIHHPLMLPFVYSDKVAERGELAGLWLRENAPPGAVIATNTAGSIPYFSKLRAIDMLGLNDSHIAHRKVDSMGEGIAGHEKADGDYIVERRPTFIMFDSATGSRKPRRPSDEEIWKNEDFHRLYDFHTFRVGKGRTFNVYMLKPEAQQP